MLDGLMRYRFGDNPAWREGWASARDVLGPFRSKVQEQEPEAGGSETPKAARALPEVQGAVGDGYLPRFGFVPRAHSFSKASVSTTRLRHQSRIARRTTKGPRQRARDVSTVLSSIIVSAWAGPNSPSGNSPA